MKSETLIHLLIITPLIGFIVSLFAKSNKEKHISTIASLTIGLHLLLVFLMDAFWMIQGCKDLNIEEVLLYENGDYKFIIDFFFDKTTAVFLTVGSILSLMVVIYSRYYMHRESGYKRFFNTILFFYLGYNLVVLSGNFETLFTGWEMLGISSFLLIAFYRDRYLPVKNAVKVFSIYRLGDIGIILAMWMSHFLWHENIPFIKLHNNLLVSEHLQAHSYMGIFISLMILLSASIKSAQLPFSSWLPRAMEGPTTSSAIFYGSLSVNMGAFLLIRMHPFWENQTLIIVLIFILGLATTLISTAISRVQSSIKSQIAYSSIAQIGLIFVELSLGFENLALLHFAGNAFLRTYQLLVSPSIVSYLMREQFYHYSETEKSIEYKYPNWIRNTFYILSIKEWNLDSFVYEAIWNPIKKTARRYKLLDNYYVITFLTALYIFGVYVYFNKNNMNFFLIPFLPVIFSSIGCILMLKSFSEKKRIFYTWYLILLGHGWITLAIAVNDLVPISQIIINLSGIVICSLIGGIVLYLLMKKEPETTLESHYGHNYEHPILSLAFFISCLGMTGFPITPTFLGEDLMFSHIHQNQVVLAFIVSFTFIIDGLSIVRMYSRIFLGSHVKTYHSTSLRSS